MLKCHECKKWLINSRITIDVEYKGKIFHATNVPANICPECNKITIDKVIKERIILYATQRNKLYIDFTKCEEEEFFCM